MQHLAPLLQTALWVGLIVYLVRRYDKALRSVVDALRARIEAGSDVTVGKMLEIKGYRPADTGSQARKLDVEVDDALKQELEPNAVVAAEAVVAEPAAAYPAPVSMDLDSTIAEPPPASYEVTKALFGGPESVRRLELKKRIALLEDLAIRRLQEQFNTQILRQVSGPSGVVLDGVFVRNGEMHTVEIKFFPSQISLAKVANQINAFADDRRNGEPGLNPIVYVLVFESLNEFIKLGQARNKLSSQIRPHVEVVSYLASDLVTQYMQG